MLVVNAVERLFGAQALVHAEKIHRAALAGKRQQSNGPPPAAFSQTIRSTAPNPSKAVQPQALPTRLVQPQTFMSSKMKRLAGSRSSPVVKRLASDQFSSAATLLKKSEARQPELTQVASTSPITTSTTTAVAPTFPPAQKVAHVQQPLARGPNPTATFNATTNLLQQPSPPQQQQHHQPFDSPKPSDHVTPSIPPAITPPPEKATPNPFSKWSALAQLPSCYLLHDILC